MATTAPASGPDGGLLVTGGLRAQTLSAGQFHTCSNRAGLVYCWGENEGGPLGTGDEVPREVPTRVGQQSDWVQVVAGDRVSCGRRLGGLVWCWGKNSVGEAADPALAPVLEPRQVDLPVRAAHIVTKFKTVCALTEEHTVWCWGDDFEGQLAEGDVFLQEGQPTPVPVQLPGNDWQSIDTGQGHSCGIRGSGELWCWGRNSNGELGLGQTSDVQIRVPTRVGSDADWVTVSAGQNTTCALRVDGSLWCMGTNLEGQIGLPETRDYSEPTEVMGARGWSDVSINTFGGCGIRAGMLYCWGRNDEGQLGTGDTEDRTEPTLIGNASDWVAVSQGRFHTCARRADDTVWCAGENNAERPLGVGDLDRRNVPSPIVAPDPLDDVR